MGRILKDYGTDLGSSHTKHHTAFGARIVEWKMYQSQQESDKILQAGEVLCEQLLNEAEQAAQRAQKTAQSQEESKTLARIISDHVSFLRLSKRRLLLMENELFPLSRAVISKIIGSSANIPSEALAIALKTSIDSICRGSQVTITLAMGHANSLKKQWPKVADMINNETLIQVQESKDVKPGSVKFICAAGTAECTEVDLFDEISLLLDDDVN